MSNYYSHFKESIISKKLKLKDVFQREVFQYLQQREEILQQEIRQSKTGSKEMLNLAIRLNEIEQILIYFAVNFQSENE